MKRRRNYLIKKKFQFAFSYGFILLLVAGALLIGALFAYVSNDTLTTGYLNSTLQVERTSRFFSAALIVIVLAVAAGIGITGLALFILLSHRIAGPLYRFEKMLKGATEGDLSSRITLRKTDQLTELKEALNDLTSSLDARIGKLKTALTEAQTLAAQSDDPGMRAQLKRSLDAIERELKAFKTTSRVQE